MNFLSNIFENSSVIELLNHILTFIISLFFIIGIIAKKIKIKIKKVSKARENRRKRALRHLKYATFKSCTTNLFSDPVDELIGEPTPEFLIVECNDDLKMWENITRSDVYIEVKRVEKVFKVKLKVERKCLEISNNYFFKIS